MTAEPYTKPEREIDKRTRSERERDQVRTRKTSAWPIPPAPDVEVVLDWARALSRQEPMPWRQFAIYGHAIRRAVVWAEAAGAWFVAPYRYTDAFEYQWCLLRGSLRVAVQVVERAP